MLLLMKTNKASVLFRTSAVRATSRGIFTLLDYFLYFKLTYERNVCKIRR